MMKSCQETPPSPAAKNATGRILLGVHRNMFDSLTLETPSLGEGINGEKLRRRKDGYELDHSPLEITIETCL